MNGKIGPHTGIEFDLYSAGRKHLIYVGFDCFPDEYLDLARDVGAECLTFACSVSDLPNYIFYRPGHLEDACRLRDLISAGVTVSDPHWADHEHEIGRLLGYSSEDVEVFLAQFDSRRS